LRNVRGRWRRERRIHVTQPRRVPLRIRAQRHGVCRIIRREAKRRLAPALHADVHQAAGALAHREEAAKDLEVLNEYIGIVRHDVAPTGAIRGLCHRNFHDTKIQRLPVGADHEAIVEMIDLVFMILLARQHHLEIERRIVGTRVAPLR
jgi:hypothetical protein